MRSLAFSVAYWAISGFYVLVAAVAVILPGSGLVRGVARFYCKRMLWAMHWFAGIKVQVEGEARLPEGSFIVAGKHHSWGDGFVMFAHVKNLTFVAGDHMERIPLLRGILRKMGAIVVNNCGGPESRRALSANAAIAHAEGRRILIYPEGHLAKVGEHFRYRTGVFHMYEDFEMPVVPVATNLGLFWPQEDFHKNPGAATVEFLEPIPVGLDRATFMQRLETAIESRTCELIAQARGEPVTPSVLVPTPDEVEAAAKAGAAAA
ncbi:MAG TPA: 1-acyl-sn-glycerol-3-phosphate acyltransferase [Caulobacteraceae bacterium]|nr:1-acyl-sn-glycerol-3-phosphate acyltransferase [Caulobacteraceae bacterium]